MRLLWHRQLNGGKRAPAQRRQACAGALFVAPAQAGATLAALQLLKLQRRLFGGASLLPSDVEVCRQKRVKVEEAGSSWAVLNS